MRFLLFLAFLFLSAVLLFSSCDNNRVSDDFHTIPHGKWYKDSVQTFTFNILRRRQNHNVYFNVRNDQKYGFSNLWLFVTLNLPGGQSKCDTVQLILAESNGKWLGKGFSGIYTNRILYKRNVYFPEPGEYSYTIQQGMRPDVLDGIAAIGIRVEKVN